MTKKIIAGVVGAVLLGVFLFGTRFFGYVGTMVDDVKHAANDAVPFEMKIKEAKKLVTSLHKEITKHEKLMAETMAERDAYGRNIERDTQRVVQLKDEMTYLASLVDGTDSDHVYVNTSDGKQKRSVTEVKTKLKGTLASYKNAQRSLENNTANRDREQTNYEQYQKFYNELIAKRDSLAQRVKQLESEKVALETRKATEAAKFDDSAIKETESFLDDLEKDLATQRNLLDIQKNHGAFDVEPNAEEEAGDILDEVKKTLDESKNSDKGLISTDA